MGLDMWVDIRIFESLQLENLYVGDFLYQDPCKKT